jgi:hypothetical protein
MSTRRVRPSLARSAFAGFCFPPQVIVLSVRWYLRFALSHRDVEELLAERGIDVDHTTVYRRVQRFTPLLTEAARPRRHAVVTAGRSMRPMSRSRASALRLPRDRPVRASHRRVRVPAAGRGRGPPVLPTRHRHDAGRTSRGDHRPHTGVPGGARGGCCRRLGIAPIGMPTTISRPTTAASNRGCIRCEGSRRTAAPE